MSHKVSPFLTVYCLGCEAFSRISFVGAVTVSAITMVPFVGSGSAMLTGAGLVVLQPVIDKVVTASSPKSVKKGTIMADLGVVELFIFVFSPWLLLCNKLVLDICEHWFYCCSQHVYE